MRFQLWFGPETGEVIAINTYATEGEAKRNGEMLAQMLPRIQHVFVTALDTEDENTDDSDDSWPGRDELSEGLYTLEYSVTLGEWQSTDLEGV